MALRTITARFDGRCWKCGGSIMRAEPCLFDTMLRKTQHRDDAECASRKAAEPKVRCLTVQLVGNPPEGNQTEQLVFAAHQAARDSKGDAALEAMGAKLRGLHSAAEESLAWAINDWVKGGGCLLCENVGWERGMYADDSGDGCARPCRRCNADGAHDFRVRMFATGPVVTLNAETIDTRNDWVPEATLRNGPIPRIQDMAEWGQRAQLEEAYSETLEEHRRLKAKFEERMEAREVAIVTAKRARKAKYGTLMVVITSSDGKWGRNYLCLTSAGEKVWMASSSLMRAANVPEEMLTDLSVTLAAVSGRPMRRVPAATQGEPEAVVF